MKKQQKQSFVKDLSTELSGANSLVLVDYQGLDVKTQGELRRSLRSVGARMIVAKNTLVKRAGEAVKLKKEVLSDTALSGPTALVFSKEDPIAPLQVLGKFAKEHGLPNMKVGIVEGNFQDKEALTKLSKLPGKDILSGQLIGAVSAPLYGLMSILEGNLQKLVGVLKSASEKDTVG